MTDYGFLHALAGPHPGHEIRQLRPDPDLCSRCGRRPAIALESLCESCKDTLADIRDNARKEEGQ
jgi:hypothetical protein